MAEFLERRISAESDYDCFVWMDINTLTFYLIFLEIF
jgi:hypothetical protein